MVAPLALADADLCSHIYILALGQVYKHVGTGVKNYFGIFLR